MKLNELLPHLEEIINGKMDTFSMLAKDSKKLREQIDKKYAEMREIVSELKYVLPIVKAQNPSIVNLIEEFEK
jgi:hypothetical protein